MARQTDTVMCMHALGAQERDLPTTTCHLSAQGALQGEANSRGRRIRGTTMRGMSSWLSFSEPSDADCGSA